MNAWSASPCLPFYEAEQVDIDVTQIGRDKA